MYEEREIYPNPPLQLVVAQVRYPYAPRLARNDELDDIQISLEDLFPIRRPEQQVGLDISPNNIETQTRNIFRLINRKKNQSVVITPDNTTIETTDYKDISGFLDIVHKVFSTLKENKAIPAVERLGLRFINEIRVPGAINNATDWKRWIREDLVPTPSPNDPEIKVFRSQITYNIANNKSLHFRYGALFSKGLVADDVLNRRTPAKEENFFALDFDSFWVAGNPDEAVSFDPESLVGLLKELHHPIEQRFQNSLQDELREVFRKKAR